MRGLLSCCHLSCCRLLISAVVFGASSSGALTAVPGYPFSTVLTIQLFDLFLWSFLAWYLDKVVPGEYGLAHPWYFLFTKRYWSSEPATDSATELHDRSSRTSLQLDDQEAVSEEVARRCCVRALDLHKTFKVNLLKESPQDKVAVDGVSFAMYEGQVTYPNPNAS